MIFAAQDILRHDEVNSTHLCRHILYALLDQDDSWLTTGAARTGTQDVLSALAAAIERRRRQGNLLPFDDPDAMTCGAFCAGTWSHLRQKHPGVDSRTR